ncbi:uncharacterized protein FYW49_010752 [Xenentodon cancila]
MACRRGQQLSLPVFSREDHKDVLAANHVDQLTFKYMEMCKVESSTDSDSEISPRWSDTSTLGCVSSASECGASRRGVSLTHKSTGKHACCSLFLDPYDGSSEDSDGSDIDVRIYGRQMRPQGKSGGGGRCFSAQRRRSAFHHSTSTALRETIKSRLRDQQSTIYKDINDVQMKYGSDVDCCRIITEEKVIDSTIQTMDIELQLNESGFHGARSSTSHTLGLQTPAESPCNLRSLCKRKLGFSGAEAVQLEPRKRQCVVYMEDDEEGKQTEHS